MSNTPEHCGATPSIDDHIRQAMDLMRRGARMRLSDIPNDPSFLSSNFGSDVSIEIAGRLSAKPANESNVKPLNWLYGQRAGLEAWVTDDYEIVLCTDGLYSLYRRHVLMCRHDMLYKVRDAAQEDHETRIRAALQSAADTPAPAPVVDRAAAFERIVAARKKHVDAVAAYNARLKIAKAERECGDWSTKLDVVYRAMSDAQSDFIRTCQDTADAALAATAAEGSDRG